MTDPRTAVDPEAVIARGVEIAIEHANRIVGAVADQDAVGLADTATAGYTDHTRSPF